MMRLWHKDLIEVLPDKMLIAQWRELSAIVGSINKNGTPNHRLVNILLDYSKEDLYIYSIKIYNELIKREFKPQMKVLNKITNYTGEYLFSKKNIFKDWHNERYLNQCYFNLEEKFDRKIISFDEWKLIKDRYSKREVIL